MQKLLTHSTSTRTLPWHAQLTLGAQHALRDRRVGQEGHPKVFRNIQSGRGFVVLSEDKKKKKKKFKNLRRYKANGRQELKTL